MPTAWSYARVSSAEQATAGGGIARQRDDTLARAWCQQHGYTFATTFQFTGSAYSGRHLQDGTPLRQWLDQACSGALGQHPALLVEEIDRFTREAGHRLLGELGAIFQAGVWLVALRDGTVYSSEAFEQDDRLLVDLLDEIRAAHRYSLRLSRRLSSYWGQVRDRAKDGKLQRPDRLAPWWISAVDGEWQLNDRAPTARRMFLRALEVGSSTIAREFNEQGIPPVTAGRRWTSGGITRHLRNPASYGLLRLLPKTNDPIEVPDHFPPLLTRAEWDQVQAAIATRKRLPETRAAQGQCWWVGQRLTRCTCGSVCEVFTSQPRPGQNYRYLRCARWRHERAVCNAHGYRLEVVTAHLLTRLQPQQLALMLGQVPADHLAKVLAAADTARQAMAAAEQQHHHAVAALEAAVLKGDGADLLLPIVRRAESALEERRDAMTQALAAVAAAQGQSVPDDLAAAVQEMLQAFAQGADTVEQRRRVHDGLRRLGLTILLDPHQRRCGLQLGDGPADWQPVDAELSRAALAAGAYGAVHFSGDADGLGAGFEW